MTGVAVFAGAVPLSRTTEYFAISADFDLTDSSSISELISLIEKVANGEETKAEILDSGEIMAPRVVRSV